jgi:hypothetical protein
MQAKLFQLLKRTPLNCYKKLLAVIVLAVSQTLLFGQNVGINSDGSLPHNSAMLDIKSSNKGLLIPRLSLKSKTDVTTITSPQESLLVYNTSSSGEGATAVSPGFYFWNGKEWSSLSATSASSLNVNNSFWSLFGNSATDTSFFIGTTDNAPLSFRINNQPAGKLSLNGNTFWGLGSGVNTTSGYAVTAIGNNALRSNTDRFNLVAVGDSALFNNGLGALAAFQASNNTAVGSKASFSNTTGSGNTAIGNTVLKSNTTGSQNTAVGNWTLEANQTGGGNTAMGAFALASNQAGSNNTGVGYGVLSFNKASGNTSAGFHSLEYNSSGFSNVAIGIEALNKNEARSNLVAIGDSALFNNGLGASTSFHGSENTAVGSKAGFSNTKGDGMTAIGFKSLFANTTGRGNTAVGHNSLGLNESGGHNTGIGNVALYSNTTGELNTALGSLALYSNTAGSRSTAVGYGALLYDKASDNTAMGYQSLANNSSGWGNVAVGTNALNTLSSGTNNTAIGLESDVTFGSIGNATAVGARSMVACSNCLVLGSVAGVNSAANTVNVGIGTTIPQQRLHVVGNILATGSITSLSDVRLKTSIIPMTKVMSSLQNINAIYYYWNKTVFPEIEVTDKRQLGFSAQEIEKYFPDLVETDSKGYKSVDYGRLTPVLLEAVKELQQQIDELKEEMGKIKH